MGTKTKQKVNKSKTPKEKYAFKPMKMNEERGSQTHNIDGTEKKERFSWFKHKVWLDGFRGKIITDTQKTKKTYKKFIK